MSQAQTLFAFDGARRIAAGSRAEVACKVSTYLQANPNNQPFIFDGVNGKQIDLDLSGEPDAVRARYAEPAETASTKAGKGRPKLGVVAKEVTLLPRHWDWLATQPGGASVTLRKLIEQASKDPASPQQQQARITAAYNFMYAVAGNLPGFEEVSRLLFAGDLEAVAAAVAGWPGDIGEQILVLAKAPH